MAVDRTFFRFLMAVAALGVSTAASTQALNLSVTPRSQVPEENALLAILARTQLKGTGQNGVPAGMTIFYKLSNPDHCAPAVEPWVTAEGALVQIPSGPAVSLRMHQIESLSAPSENLVLLIYKDGTSQPIATGSLADRQSLLDAIQAFGAYCRTQPPPPAAFVLGPAGSAK
jgi:hypothetical protein